METKNNSILSAVTLFDNNVTACVAKGVLTGDQPDLRLQHWVWSSDCNYTILEVLKPVPEYDTPFVAVIGFRSIWFNN